MFAEFRKFAIRGNVADLAVGVVIGTAFTAIVNSLVKDVIMPPFGFLLGGIDFSNLFITLKGTHEATLKAAQEAGAVTLNYGQFLGTIFNFLIIAFALFLVLRELNKLMATKEPPPPPPEELAVLREIRDLLKERRA